MAHLLSFVMGLPDECLFLVRLFDRVQCDCFEELSFSIEGQWCFMKAFKVGTQVQMIATLISTVLKEKRSANG